LLDSSRQARNDVVEQNAAGSRLHAAERKSMIDKLTVRSRVLAGFAMVLALFVIVAGQSVYRARESSAAMDYVLRDKLHNERIIVELDGIIRYTVADSIAAAKTDDAKYEAGLLEATARRAARAAEIVEELRRTIADEQAKQLLSDVVKERGVYVLARDELRAIKARDGRDAVDAFIARKFKSEADEFQTVVNKLQKQLIDERRDQMHADNEVAIRVTLGLTVFAALLGVAAAVVVGRSVVRQLGGEPGDAAHVAQRIAEGDLSVRVQLKPGDTVSVLYAMQVMRDRLADIVAQVRRGTTTIRSASDEIAQGALELSARTEQQASALEETAASMEELTSTVRQNAGNTAQAHSLAGSAEAMAVEGGRAVEAVVATMDTIKTSSGQIAAIIAVIDGIAFQTNILALNAAVEAARAGEQGRGFAVVASEVRNLAQRAAAAARDIKQLIEGSADHVEQGTARVADAGAKIAAVVDGFRTVSRIIAEIATASTEQTSGIEQINKAVVEMDNVTQQNAALVEESAAAAQSMQEQAEALAQLVGFFRLDEQPAQVAVPGANRGVQPARLLVAA
jgi:methyl-accepting chemotaxis protein